MSTSTFALSIDGDDEDAELDLLDAVLDAGIDDDQWDWLVWQDARGYSVMVVRGTLAARGAFVDAGIGSTLSLAQAHASASDNRSQWRVPRSASEGVDALDHWLREPGFEITREALTPTPVASRSAAPAAPLKPRGRDRLPSIAVPVVPASQQPSQPSSHRASSGGGQRSGQRRARATSMESHPALAAFAAGLADKSDSSGKAFDLYRIPPGADDSEPEPGSDD